MYSTLHQIAQLLATLPRDPTYSNVRVDLGPSNAAADALATLPEARVHVSVYDDGGAIEGVEVRVDGIAFHAARSARPATAEELETLRATGRPSKSSTSISMPLAKTTPEAPSAGKVA